MTTYARYTVTLRDTGTYRLTVAAADPDQAVTIARQVLDEHVFRGIKGVHVQRRDTEGEAVLCTETPAKEHRFHFQYVADFEDSLLAADREEATRLAEWLIAASHPTDFDLENESKDSIWAEEVAS